MYYHALLLPSPIDGNEIQLLQPFVEQTTRQAVLQRLDPLHDWVIPKDVAQLHFLLVHLSHFRYIDGHSQFSCAHRNSYAVCNLAFLRHRLPYVQAAVTGQGRLQTEVYLDVWWVEDIGKLGSDVHHGILRTTYARSSRSPRPVRIGHLADSKLQCAAKLLLLVHHHRHASWRRSLP